MTRKRNKERSDNRIAILGITVVVIFLAIAVHIRSITLHEQDRNYALQEESLDAEIANEQHHSEELQKQKVYVKTKEYTMEKAREIVNQIVEEDGCEVRFLNRKNPTSYL